MGWNKALLRRSCNITSQICLILRFLGPTQGLLNQKLWGKAWESVFLKRHLSRFSPDKLGKCQGIRS